MFLFQDRTIWPLWIQRVRQSVTWSFRNHLDLLLKKNVFPLLLETVFLLNIFLGTVILFSVFLNRKKRKKNNLFEIKIFFNIINILTVTFDLFNVKNNYKSITYWLYFRIKNSHFWNDNILPLCNFLFQKCFMHFLSTFMHFPPKLVMQWYFIIIYLWWF